MKTIILTGATDGIGFETAKMFAHDGYKLLLHGRSLARLENVKQALLEINSGIDIELYVADFSSMADINKMADNILAKHNHIDVLINNAGVFVVDDNQVMTKDMLDVRFEVNTIAPYILTKKLLPILDSTSRVVNISSAAQAIVRLDALDGKRKLTHNEAYAQSKLALIMWTMDMAEKYADKGVFVSVNPKSFLGSKMVKEAYGKQGLDLKLGADILYRAALSDEFADANGKYYDNDYGVFADPHPYAQDKGYRKMVVDAIEKIIA